MNIQIFPIPTMLDTIYAIKGEGVILIDGGDPNHIEKIKTGLNKASIKPEEVKLILLTHGHWDHVGSTKEIQALTNARVFLHQKDMYLLKEAHPSNPPGFTAYGKFVIALINLYCSMLHTQNFNVDIIAGDEEISLQEFGIPGRVIPTPGHSWGSVSVLLDDGKAFVGDLATSLFLLRRSPGLIIFGHDLQMMKNSMQKLLDMGAKMIYPGHGKPFPAEILQKTIA